MQNPFESGHIKNYILLYASVLVIIILFFIASTLFNEVEVIQKKEFDTEVREKIIKEDSNKTKSIKHQFKILDKAY